MAQEEDREQIQCLPRREFDALAWRQPDLGGRKAPQAKLATQGLQPETLAAQADHRVCFGDPAVVEAQRGTGVAADPVAGEERRRVTGACAQVCTKGMSIRWTIRRRRARKPKRSEV